MNKGGLFLVTLATAAVFSPAGAQGLPSSEHLDLIHRGAFLLANRTVRANLKLSPAQTAKIDRSFQAYYAKQQTLMGGSQPKDAALKQLDFSTTDLVLQSLDATQRQKLNHVALQEAGVSALMASDVATRLQLRGDQLKKIKEVIEDAQQPSLDLEEKIANRIAAEPSQAEAIQKSYAPERRRVKVRQSQEEAKALDVLTPAQLSLWRAMSS